MNKIRIIQHAKYLGFSGTERTSQLFYKYLNQSDRFDCYLLYREGYDECRREIVESWYGKEKVISYKWKSNRKNNFPPYMPEEDNFFDVVAQIDPDIVHVHRSGRHEWPGMRYLAPKARWIETNIFGEVDTSGQIDLNIYISEYNKNLAVQQGGKQGPVLYNPIELPPENKDKCRERLCIKYNLPLNGVILGRIGRRDNFDPISLKAFKQVEDLYPEVYYLVVNPCQGWYDTVRQLDIKNVRFIDSIVSDLELWDFYLGIDIYAHARSDGDICPVSIQQAMMAGKPVISHQSIIYNGQSEIIGDTGFVVPVGDYIAYADVLMRLVTNPTLRSDFGQRAHQRAMMYFEASNVTKQLEKIYDEQYSPN